MTSDALKVLVDSINERMRNTLQAQHQNHQMMLEQQAQAHFNLLDRLSQPKQVIRGADGKITGVK